LSLVQLLPKQLLLKKSLADSDGSHSGLHRTLGVWEITLLGVGATVGAGIFATIGTASAGDAVRAGAGPSIMLSFVITATVCAFTALCYAELAAMVPSSGSAYTYAYASLGELCAWVIGWDLILEYTIGNIAMAIGWSAYFRVILENLGIHVPWWLCTDYRSASAMPDLMATAPQVWGVPIVVNVLAIGIVAFLTGLCIWGIRESVRFNTVMVIIKLAVLAFFVGTAFYMVPVETMQSNWQPFMPNGITGTLSGAAIVFFAFIGFDAVSTVAEETKNPRRDLPLGILIGLGICTLVYVVVAAAFTGMIPYSELITRSPAEQAEALTMALGHILPDARWATLIVAVGSVLAHAAVLLVFQLGQPRIFFAMARDGLLPPVFASVHPRFRTPHVTTALTGFLVAFCAAVANIEEMVDLCNIGTLFAFMIVCISIPILRRRQPDAPRPFKVPFGNYLLPGLGAASCLGLMWYLPPASWYRFAGWLMLGLAIYAYYGYRTSRAGRRDGRASHSTWPQRALATVLLGATLGLFLISAA
jgi:APA family basic amino acid/polyamine antiporter